MSEHVQHKGDQDAEILLQVSGKQVEHKHALGIWLKTKSWLEDLIPVTSSIFHMGQRKENLYLRKKSNETPASMHELLADEELEPELGLTGKQHLNHPSISPELDHLNKLQSPMPPGYALL
nr:PREDICTED: uncharacterized protein LOC108953632 isoform X2 [Musa acuminata subsp. malaccensis]